MENDAHIIHLPFLGQTRALSLFSLRTQPAPSLTSHVLAGTTTRTFAS